MNCRCDLCIYNKKSKCNVKKIEINDLGVCDMCISVTFDTKTLENAKAIQLEKMEREWFERKK